MKVILLGKQEYVLFFGADDYVQSILELPEKLDKYADYFQFRNEESLNKNNRAALVKNNGNAYGRGLLYEFLEHRNPVVHGMILGDYYSVSG